MGAAHTYPLEFMLRPSSAILRAQEGLQMDLPKTILPRLYKASASNENVPGVFSSVKNYLGDGGNGKTLL